MALPVILAAEQFYAHPRGSWHHLPAHLWAWEKHPISDWRRSMIGPLPKLGTTVGKPAAFAYVNHGRWLVECPFCGSVQVAAKTDQRFLCAGDGGCGNAQVGGASLAVVWPKDADKIEAELVKRPTPNNRNWLPGETVKDLKRENADRGMIA